MTQVLIIIVKVLTILVVDINDSCNISLEREEDGAEMMPSGSMAKVDVLEGGSAELKSQEEVVLAEALSMDSSESKEENNGEVSGAH